MSFEFFIFSREQHPYMNMDFSLFSAESTPASFLPGPACLSTLLVQPHIFLCCLSAEKGPLSVSAIRTADKKCAIFAAISTGWPDFGIFTHLLLESAIHNLQ
jgi:hypothetical protein